MDSGYDLHLKIPPGMAEKIDQAAKAAFQSRSAYIREAIALRLNGQYISKAQAKEQEFDQLIQHYHTGNHLPTLDHYKKD